MGFTGERAALDWYDIVTRKTTALSISMRELLEAGKAVFECLDCGEPYE
jgi:hypothetical protein